MMDEGPKTKDERPTLRPPEHVIRNTQYAIPTAFLERMSGLLGSEYPAFLASYDVPTVAGLRVNTLKISAGSVPASGSL